MPAREAGLVGLGRHGRAWLLPDPDGEAGGALHEQELQGVRAAVAGARVRRGPPARPEEGVGAQVPQVRDAPRRAAGALHGRQLRVRAARPHQVLSLGFGWLGGACDRVRACWAGANTAN